MQIDKKSILTNLFREWCGEELSEWTPLPPSGSYREYYRMKSVHKQVLGVYNSDKKENTAFISFTEHFLSKGLPVPAILAKDEESDIYLVEDLGDVTLFSFISAMRQEEEFSPMIVDVYKRVLDVLPEFQITAGRDIDYTKCYPRERFDKQSMMWDLNYFKYYFLKLGKIPFDEQALETDFNTFIDYLLAADCDYFLYRDFQSRNIMLKDGKPYFIDYQGGRAGALHYDLASLLFDAKADLPPQVRTELLHYYIATLKKHTDVNESGFIQMFFGYVLIRIMQAMGAYGFRGFYEKKEHFLKSIPFAIENLKWLLTSVTFPVKVPALLEALRQITVSKELEAIGGAHKSGYRLYVSVNSFSYKKGIPQDNSGNGGGFVFDCRAIHNPGRYEQYKLLTGKDAAVQKFLLEESDVESFLTNAFALVKQSVELYTSRKFTHLMVSFGCTGGRHRSVYCAERLAAMLQNFPEVHVKLHHVEQDKQ